MSLVILLAREGELKLAEEQLKQCLKEVDPEKIRGLTPEALFRLLFLSKALHQPMPDPDLLAFAKSLLPDEWRARL